RLICPRRNLGHRRIASRHLFRGVGPHLVHQFHLIHRFSLRFRCSSSFPPVFPSLLPADIPHQPHHPRLVRALALGQRRARLLRRPVDVEETGAQQPQPPLVRLTHVPATSENP